MPLLSRNLRYALLTLPVFHLLQLSTPDSVLLWIYSVSSQDMFQENWNKTLLLFDSSDCSPEGIFFFVQLSVSGSKQKTIYLAPMCRCEWFRLGPWGRPGPAGPTHMPGSWLAPLAGPGWLPGTVQWLGLSRSFFHLQANWFQHVLIVGGDLQVLVRLLLSVQITWLPFGGGWGCCGSTALGPGTSRGSSCCLFFYLDAPYQKFILHQFWF